jgi:hypothetical protein
MSVRHVRFLAFLAAAIVIAACSDIGIAPGSATVRFVNAIPGAGQLSFESNIGFPVNDITFEGYSGCTTVAAQTATFSFGGSGSGIAPFTMNPVTLFGGAKYTIVATGSAAAPSSFVLADTFSAPAAGSAMLRIVNDIPSAGNVDIYVDVPGAPLVTPKQTNIPVGGVAFIPVPAGTSLQVWLTTAAAGGGGIPAVIATTTTFLSFADGQEESLFFIAPSGGSTPLYFVVPNCS